MRKKMAIVGAVILIAGVVMFFSVSAEILGSTTVGNSLSKAGNGEWETPELNVTFGGEVTVISNSSDVALVPASDISTLTSSNIMNYSISPKSGANTSAGSVSVYTPPAGSYYFVSFSKSSPSITYTVLNSAGTAIVYGLLEIAAVIMGIGGLIVLIVGVILKEKNSNQFEELF